MDMNPIFVLFGFANAVEKKTKMLATTLTQEKAVFSLSAVLNFETQWDTWMKAQSQRWWENIVLASFTEQDWLGPAGPSIIFVSACKVIYEEAHSSLSGYSGPYFRLGGEKRWCMLFLQPDAFRLVQFCLECVPDHLLMWFERSELYPSQILLVRHLHPGLFTVG